jgi:hypothetical protein
MSYVLLVLIWFKCAYLCVVYLLWYGAVVAFCELNVFYEIQDM